MICITCGARFHKIQFQNYFCSKICWEDASKNIPWSVVSDDVEPLNYPVKLTTPPRHPPVPRHRERTRSPVKDSPDGDYRWCAHQAGMEAADRSSTSNSPRLGEATHFAAIVKINDRRETHLSSKSPKVAIPC
jgi:hypothetical protein